MAARRTITIVFDEDPTKKDMTKEEYADFGNGIWGVLKMARPAGGFHLESDGGTTVNYLNSRWAQHGGQLPWQ
jgi:hypothetical protein